MKREILAVSYSSQNMPNMENYHSSGAWHCAVMSLISLFGLSYFSVLFAQTLLFHWSSIGNEILKPVSVIVFCTGVMIWCFLTLLEVSSTLRRSQRTACRTSEFELGAVIVLIWTSTLPTVLLLFETQPSIQLEYAIILTIAFLGRVLDLVTFNSDRSVVRIRFSYHCVSLGLLCLAPAVQALVEIRPKSPTQATEFIYMVTRNCLGAAIYLIGPFERLNIMPSLQPSLCMMHLFLVYGLISYSRALIQAAL